MEDYLLMRMDRYIKFSRRQFMAFSVFVVLIYHLLRYVHPDIWGQIYCVYYMFLVPALIAVYFAYKRLEGPVELKLFVFYWIWIFVSRLLNGDFYLTHDGDMVLNMGLGCVMMAVCLLLEGKERQRFLDGISIAVGGFYSLLSVCGLYAALYQKELYNPLTGGSLCSFWYYDGLSRLQLLGKHANETAVWFFLGFFLLMYLFFRHKSLLWRIPIVAAAAMNYINLCMTFSRSNMVAFSVCFSLLLAMVILRRLSAAKMGRQLLATMGLLLVLLPLSYKSFDITAEIVGRAATELAAVKQQAAEQIDDATQQTAAVQPEAEAEIEAAEQIDDATSQTAAVQPEAGAEIVATPAPAIQPAYSDKRGFSDTGRFTIYRAIIPTMQQEPLRLVRGCLCMDVMKIAHQYLINKDPHFHNTFLQVLCITGLPGLLLILALCAVLAMRIIRLLFSAAPLEIKVLTLILIGLFIYNMLEVSLFVAADTRAFVAYILAGAVIAYDKEQNCKTRAMLS